MKKLFIILISISSNCFGAVGTLRAPFAEARYENSLTTAGRLVIPPMVAEAVYLEAVSADCRQFQDTVAKYKTQINDEEAVSLVTAPLAYSMKKNYEIEVILPAVRTIMLAESGELLLQSTGKAPMLEWDEVDLLANVMKPSAGYTVGEEPSLTRLIFTRRDMFCSFAAGKLGLNSERQVYWKLSDSLEKVMTKNLSLIFESLRPALKSENGSMLEAAMAGRAIHLALRQTDFQAEKKFTSLEYIWNLIFENENSMQKTALWKLDSAVFLQKETHMLKLRGLH